MQIYTVDYCGSWLGGRAIVVADTPEQAMELTEDHPDTMNFKDVTITQCCPALFVDGGVAQVIDNNAGEY